MKPFNELSQHDQELLKKIRRLDEDWGWSRWPEISSLADQLEDEERKAFWNRDVEIVGISLLDILDVATFSMAGRDG